MELSASGKLPDGPNPDADPHTDCDEEGATRKESDVTRLRRNGSRTLRAGNDLITLHVAQSRTLILAPARLCKMRALSANCQQERAVKKRDRQASKVPRFSLDRSEPFIEALKTRSDDFCNMRGATACAHPRYPGAERADSDEQKEPDFTP
jgi:hypothetical protein